MSSSTVLVRQAPKTQTSRNKTKIGDRAYVLLSIVEGKTEQAARALWNMPGVSSVDCLEGNPSVIVILEAHDRLALAELLMLALTTVDGITKDLRLLVTRENPVNAATSTP